MTFLSFDNHFETKVLFLMYFGSQIINEYCDDDLYYLIPLWKQQ